MSVASATPVSTALASHAADWSGDSTGRDGMGRDDGRGRRLLVALSDRPPEGDLAVIDAEIEAAVGIGTDPRLVRDRRALAPVVGERNQGTLRALLARRKFDLVHVPPSARPTPRSGAPHAGPLVDVAEGVGE